MLDQPKFASAGFALMEINTGASYSVISRATHKLLWPRKRLMPTTVKLCTGEPLAVKASMMTQVRYGDS